MFFGNILTQYLRIEKVDEEPEFDVIIPAPLRGTDITSIRAKEENDMTMLTGFEHNARDDSFMVM